MAPLELADLLAREAIRDLVTRYNSYGDSGLFDLMIGLFAHEATLEVGEQSYHGVEAIRDFLSGVPGRVATGHQPTPAYLRHCTATHQIDLVDGAHASGRCYFLVLTAVGLDHWGRYLDDYEVVGGTWRFARRRVLTDGRSPQSLFGPRSPTAW